LHLERQRTEYTLSHGILRLVLSEYAPVKPEMWEFSAGRWGKPKISRPVTDPPLWFNLSHTDGFIACVAGRVPEVGVDVENTGRKISYATIAKHSFAPAECDYLRNLPTHLQRDAFFRIWTLKEAYAKATGEGLAVGLDSFHFRLSTMRPSEVALEFSDDRRPQGWRFFELQPDSRHRVSIGVRGPAEIRFHVICHVAQPLLQAGVA
jgi:4'-phosphopantetheinyl transferase